MSLLEKIHCNETFRNEQFPVTKEQTFFGNAGMCPLPQCAVTAMSEYVQGAARQDQFQAGGMRLMAEAKKYAQQLLGIPEKNCALIGPTSMGLATVASGLDWKAGDNVVFSPLDYPSNAVVWMDLARKGVELRPINPAVPGCITPEVVEPQLDERTKLVALSSAHFVSGYRLPVTAIGTMLKERDILFSLDSIQTLGALQTPLEYVDFAPADSHKWLLGPSGAGLLYVSDRGMEALHPPMVGWANVECPDFLTPKELVFHQDARRYEPGSPTMVGLAGMVASLKMLASIGIEKIEDQVLTNTRHIRAGLRAKGYQLASEEDQAISGITSFRKKGIAMSQLHERFTAENIYTSLRSTKDGQQWIRFSPHFYNTRAEIDHALALL